MEPHSSFRFTSTKSFQLFSQGLESLQAYERNASAVALTAAEQSFQECVSRFPRDLLPRFYYGVVKTLTGYNGLDEAIKQFNLILNSDASDLLPDATYNLAVAHLEKYNSEDSQIALDLLKRTRSEIAKRPAEPKVESLRLQALILEIYLFVETNLWSRRQDTDSPPTDLFEEAKNKLDAFWSDYEHARILEASRPDLMADYANTRGTYWESCAWFSQGDKKRALSAEAARSFQQALEAKRNWVPAKSNLARVYQELLDEPEIARRLWQEVLDTRPHDEYAAYMLGNLHQQEGETARAIAYYKKAPHIPEANLKLGLLYNELGDVARARTYLQKVVESKDTRTGTKQQAKEALQKIEGFSEGSTPA
jgi:TolA-binding protein